VASSRRYHYSGVARRALQWHLAPEGTLLRDSRPIGVFDSGIGGLTVLREIQRQQPAERCIYVGDSRENPYGTRPPRWIRRRCEQVVDYLMERDVKLVVVACNAASVSALEHLRERYAVPFVGIVPAVKPAAAMTKTGRIGVLTTPITAESEALAQLIRDFTEDVEVQTQPCPGLVPLVERGVVDGPEVETLLRQYLNPMLRGGVDVVVLGCTHYPFLRAAMERVCGPDVTLIDPAEAVARQVGRVLQANGVASQGDHHGTCYVTTGDREHFRTVLGQLIGELEGSVHAIEL
jgi:glutamate racemase